MSTISPDLIQSQIIADLMALFPGDGTSDAYAVYGSYGVPGGPESDADLMQKRYGRMVALPGGGYAELLRGFWVEWSTGAYSREYLAHRLNVIENWSINGVYEITHKDSDEMIIQLMKDIHAIREYYRLNPQMTIDGASVTTITPDSMSGIQYDGNTQMSIAFAGSQIYRPTISLATWYNR